MASATSDSTAVFTRIINNARVQLPGAIDDGIRYELYNVLDELLSQSNIWWEDIPFDCVQGETSYDIVPVNGRIVQLLGLRYAGQGIPTTEIPASMPQPGWLLWAQAPSEPRECLCRISLTVLDPVTRAGLPVCPTWILQRYHGTITSGLIYKMAAQQNKPWSNDEIATLHGQKFRNEIGSARVDHLHQHTQGAQRWVFPQAFMPMSRS